MKGQPVVGNKEFSDHVLGIYSKLSLVSSFIMNYHPGAKVSLIEGRFLAKIKLLLN